jgi:anti-anti-sigma factor
VIELVIGARTRRVDEFKVTVADLDPSGVVVAVRGELDLDTAERLWAHMVPLLVRNAVVVVDAASMPFMDSSGLRVLIQASRRASEIGATFRVAALHSAAARVVELAGVGGQLSVRENVADALDG